MVEQLNNNVNNAHYSHYIDKPCGLVDTSLSATPNENLIYHLYSTGKISYQCKISYQKGSWAYKQQSEFTLKHKLTGAKKHGFKFPLKSDNDKTTTYAILTKIECQLYRTEMEKIIDNEKYRMVL
jgi:hypothetical protein